jgi:hypothetical protein
MPSSHHFHATAQLSEALRHKPDGRRFDFRCQLIFSDFPKPSSRIMALGTTVPTTEMSTRNVLAGKARPARKANNLTPICEPTVYKI